MNSTLVLDICEKPKFAIFANYQLVLCSEFESYSLESVLEESIRSFNVTEVKCMIKPVDVGQTKYFPLTKAPNGYVNVSVRDVNAIVSLCKQNDIDKVSFVSYISYYNLMRKGATIVLDYTYGDKMLAVVFDTTGLKAVHIEASNVIEKLLREKYKVGEEDKYVLVNARAFRLDDLYNEMVYGYDKSLDKYSSALSPVIFGYVERNIVDLMEQIKEHIVQEDMVVEQPVVEEHISEPPKDEQPKKVPKQVQKKKSNTITPNRKTKREKLPNKRSREEDIEVVDVPSKGSGIFNFVNVILGLLLGLCIVLTYQLPSDLAGLHEYLYSVKQQTEVYSSFNEMAERISKTGELDSAKLEYIYSGIKSCPVDCIIGKIDIAGDNVELEVYMGDSGNMSVFTSYLGSVMNILNTQDQGSVSIGNKTMLKVIITGQINY